MHLSGGTLEHLRAPVFLEKTLGGALWPARMLGVCRTWSLVVSEVLLSASSWTVRFERSVEVLVVHGQGLSGPGRTDTEEDVCNTHVLKFLGCRGLSSLAAKGLDCRCLQTTETLRESVPLVLEKRFI